MVAQFGTPALPILNTDTEIPGYRVTAAVSYGYGNGAVKGRIFRAVGIGGDRGGFQVKAVRGFIGAVGVVGAVPFANTVVVIGFD